jgi:hypothetical protein
MLTEVGNGLVLVKRVSREREKKEWVSEFAANP